MIRPIGRIRLIGLILCCTLVARVTAVHAQSVGLSISPPTVEILLAPNKKVTQTFILKNQGETVDIVPEIHAVTPSDSVGHVAVDLHPVDPSSLPLLVSSDHPLGTPFPLPAGAVVPVAIMVEGANVDAPVDTYLAVVFKAISPLSPLSSPFSPIPAISSLLLVSLTPTGTLPIKLELTSFDLPLIHDSMTPLPIPAVVKNQAEVMIRPGGSLTVLAPQGKTVAALPLYPNLILKGSERIILAEKMGADGKTPEGVPLSWQPQWYEIGPYRLRLAVTTEGGTKVTETEKIIWLLPIRAIGVGFLLALVIIILLYKLRASSHRDDPLKSL